MLRRGLFRVVAYNQAQRTGVTTAKVWLSGTAAGGKDDRTPAKTKLTFSSNVYGKDPTSAAELSASEASITERLKKEIEAGDVEMGAGVAPVHDNRNMFDSTLSQQAEDGKAYDSIKRDVASDTPDATRVAFRASAYGKDPQASDALSEEEAAEVEALQMRAQGSVAGAGVAAAPVHDSRSMFDSDLTQGVGRTSDSIKRDVAADTPDATRVAFRASAYGKDPQASDTLSEEEAAEVEALQMRAQSGVAGAGVAAAPVHDSRSMFDSDLTQGVGRTSDSIKRDVATDTPDATRVAFRASVYGKDAQSAAALSEEEAAEVEVLRAEAGNAGVASGIAAPAPVHDSRSMFDSDLTQGVGRTSDVIKRDVATDTPEATRLVFGGSDYGKDQRSLTRTEEKQAEMEALATRVGAGTATAAAAPIHHDRSMFDSDLAEGAGSAPESKSIKRNVKAATPELTRLSFFGSTYGDDDPGADKAQYAKALAEKQKKGAKLVGVGKGVQGSKVHDTKQAMGDDEYSHAGSE